MIRFLAVGLPLACEGTPASPVATVAAPVQPAGPQRSVEVRAEASGAGRLPAGGRFDDGLVFISTPNGLLTAAPKDQEAYATLHLGQHAAGAFQWEIVPNPGSATTLRAVGFQGGVVAVGAVAARVVAWRPGSALAELGSWDWPSAYDGWMDAVTADVDGDGDLDLALGGYDAGVVMLGRAQGDELRFETLRATDQTRVASVGWGDVDGDGRSELVTTRAHGLKGESGEIEVLSRNTDRWTATTVWEAEEFFTREVRVGDADGDGRSDVMGLRPGLSTRDLTAGAMLVGFDTSTLPWRVVPLATLPAPACHATTFADLDGDGRQDWVGACTRKGLYAWRRGALETIDPNSDGTQRAMAAGDLDRDGRDELYVADDPSREIRKYRLTGTGWVHEVVATYPPMRSVVGLAVVGGR